MRAADRSGQDSAYLDVQQHRRTVHVRRAGIGTRHRPRHPSGAGTVPAPSARPRQQARPVRPGLVRSAVHRPRRLAPHRHPGRAARAPRRRLVLPEPARRASHHLGRHIRNRRGARQRLEDRAAARNPVRDRPAYAHVHGCAQPCARSRRERPEAADPAAPCGHGRAARPAHPDSRRARLTRRHEDDGCRQPGRRAALARRGREAARQGVGLRSARRQAGDRELSPRACRADLGPRSRCPAPHAHRSLIRRLGRRSRAARVERDRRAG